MASQMVALRLVMTIRTRIVRMEVMVAMILSVWEWLMMVLWLTNGLER